MATHFSILACRIPRTEESSRLQSMWLLRVRQDSGHLAHLLASFYYINNTKINFFNLEKRGRITPKPATVSILAYCLTKVSPDTVI